MTRHPSTSTSAAPVRLLLACALIASCGGFLACQPGSESSAPADAVGETVENQSLGVAIAELPAFFKVVDNSGATIELAPADPAVEGTVTIAASEPETGGINLVAAVEEHKADLLAKEGGEFKGQREMTFQFGTAFYSRGIFSEGERILEETKIHALHPAGDRRLVLTYRYPSAEDTAQRLNDQLFAVLGELVALDLSSEGDAPAEDSSAEVSSEQSAG
ncbi:MAG: hypothetical protein AAF725_11410 [Acidobacteriota bacterium]